MSNVALSGNASGTGTLTIAAPNTNSNRTLTLPDGTGTIVASGVNSAITAGTAVASTSGTSIDFTSIPSWVKRITVLFAGVSTNGSSTISVQLGTSGGIESTGYAAGGATSVGGLSSVGATSTSRFLTQGGGGASDISHGLATISLISTNAWVFSFIGAHSQAGNGLQGGGSKTLSGTLDRVRITTVNGTDTFDAGSINILYE